MIDTHIHVIPNVDDGSDTLEESLSMLRCAAKQGVTAVIATPHSSAYDFGYESVLREYQLLRQTVSAEGIPVRVSLGTEILCYESDMDEIIHFLREGIYPTMNGTCFVLAEFFPNAARKAVFCCLKRLQEAGYCPILAHAERYRYIDVHSACELHNAGVYLQMNIYSVKEEQNDRIRIQARGLLENGLIDFAGSDAHRITRRPPRYTEGVEYMYRKYDRAYIDRILVENPEGLLLCGR